MIDPTPDTIRALATQGGDDAPVVMLNLLRFAEGGRETYEQYARAAQPFLAKAEAEVLYAGLGAQALVAEPGQSWDAVIVVRYPSRAAFLRMVMDPGYLAITHLRTKALREAVLQPTTAWSP
jgi:uncharacterized protein (DUF1330 family)